MITEKVTPTVITADQVWAASAYAHRINKGYKKTKNMQMVKEQLKENLSKVSDRDHAVGRMAKDYFKKEMLFRALRGNLSDFESKLATATGMEEFEYHNDKLYWCVIPSQIRSFVQTRVYEDCLNGVDVLNQPVADMKNRVDLQVRIVKHFYSQNWDTHYHTALTSANQLVRFAFKEKMNLGKQFSIKGTVVDFADNTTKLNRVTILNKE